MFAEEEPDEKWLVHFSEMQKCLAIGSINLYTENKYKEKLNTKIPSSLLDADCPPPFFSHRSSGRPDKSWGHDWGTTLIKESDTSGVLRFSSRPSLYDQTILPRNISMLSSRSTHIARLLCSYTLAHRLAHIQWESKLL